MISWWQKWRCKSRKYISKSNLRSFKTILTKLRTITSRNSFKIRGYRTWSRSFHNYWTKSAKKALISLKMQKEIRVVITVTIKSRAPIMMIIVSKWISLSLRITQAMITASISLETTWAKSTSSSVFSAYQILM